MFVRAYLRASTKEQDADRARADLIRFADERGQRIACYYVENESGASLARPELFRLLADEQVDRLSRLTATDWERLKGEIRAKSIRIVALDLPTSWLMLDAKRDDFTARLFEAVNGMMLDVLAAVARKDYEDGRGRQAQGIAGAKEKGLYRGRPADTTRNADIAAMLKRGDSWSFVQRTTGASRSTLARIKKQTEVEPVS